MSLIYMNNAATSWPKPAAVAEAVARALTERPGAAHRGGVDDFDVFSAVCTRLALRLGATDSTRIALGPNATWALNTAISGFPLNREDVVVTTNAEHNSVLRPLFALARDKGAKVIHLETDGAGRVPPNVWQSAMDWFRPKLAVFTHASNVTGAVQDAGAMAKAAKAVGAAVLLDASQTLGWQPLFAESWGVDMVAFTGHKYLLGPQGTGGLWVRPGLALSPVLVGGTGIHSELYTMPEAMPLRLEAGTGNEPSFFGLLAALNWADANPLDKQACDARTQRLKDGLSKAGATVVQPEGDCTPVVSFNLPGMAAEEAGFLLQESYDILCRTGLHCAPKVFGALGVPSTVRLSLSRFTTDDEVEEAVCAVEEILA